MYIVPLHPAGEEVQETCCERCLARRPVSETFAGVSRDPSADVLDLIQHTNAPILDHTAGLAAEFARQRGAPAGDGGRLRTIRFVLFTTGWTAMWRSEHGSISPPMGVGVLLALVLIAVGPLAWWGNGPFAAWGLPAAGVGLLLIGTLFPAIVRGQRRWARTRPAYLAARGLFDLQPTGAELDDACGQLREDGNTGFPSPVSVERALRKLDRARVPAPEILSETPAPPGSPSSLDPADAACQGRRDGTETLV